jgi:hypothetical protein
MGLELKLFTELLPKLVKNPKLLITDQKALSNGIPLLSFLAPFGGLIVGPLLLFLTDKHEKEDKKETRKSVYQEFLGQSITVVTHSTSFILGGLLARHTLPRLNKEMFTKGSQALENGETLACISGSFFGATFIRPFLTAKLLHKQDEKSKDKQPEKLSHPPPPLARQSQLPYPAAYAVPYNPYSSTASRV